MQSIGQQTSTTITNPYTALLIKSLSERVDVQLFSWSAAIRGNYEVLHVHWPELMIRGSGWKGVLKPLFLALLLIRLVDRRKIVVRTAHNIQPHETGTRLERWLLQRFEARTDGWLVMNRATAVPRGARTYYVPHGHYRDWYKPTGRDPVPRSVLFFGSIKGYKGMEDLLAAITDARSEFAIRIAGKVSDPETRARLENLSRQDRRVSVDLRFVPDEELAELIERSERVILPYRNLHNSGALILALSLGRPVIVPDTPSTRELAAEFGTNWVSIYEGSLTGAKFDHALTVPPPAFLDGGPDMSKRSWDEVADATCRAYDDLASHIGIR